MNSSHITQIPYANTGYFSKLLINYIAAHPTVQPFYQHPVSIQGIEAAIQARQQFNTNRTLLVQQLQLQYKNITLTAQQQQYLQALHASNTFTITTAHQPNIFTGPLYFLYKIAHAIALCNQLNTEFKNVYNFVPIYYMGSEDADFDELNNITISGKKYTWNTQQTGAVGKMTVDKNLLSVLQEIEQQIAVLPFGNQFIQILKNSYLLGKSIQECTLNVVNGLFAQYGLLVLIPDNGQLKKSFENIVKKELELQFSSKQVKATVALLQQHYNVQASGRDINLFYLDEGKRERIVFNGNYFAVNNTSLIFSKEEMMNLVQNEPQKISANVILRGVFQETILPNIAFIGGGGEIAYWLELKKVFEAAEVPFPILITRNSFLFIQTHQHAEMHKMGFQSQDFFRQTAELQNNWVHQHSNTNTNTSTYKIAFEAQYNLMAKQAATIDASLVPHVQALQAKAIQSLHTLEKKMLRAEKRKHTDTLQKLEKLKLQLFPNNSLQERVENAATLYGTYGTQFIDYLVNNSLGLQQQFTVVELAD